MYYDEHTKPSHPANQPASLQKSQNKEAAGAPLIPLLPQYASLSPYPNPTPFVLPDPLQEMAAPIQRSGKSRKKQSRNASGKKGRTSAKKTPLTPEDVEVTAGEASTKAKDMEAAPTRDTVLLEYEAIASQGESMMPPDEMKLRLLEDADDDYYQKVLFAVRAYPDLFNINNFFQTMGILEACNFSYPTLEQYGDALFRYRAEIQKGLEAHKDTSYLDYLELFTESFFTGDVVTLFFEIDPAVLQDAYKGIAFVEVLQSTDRTDFLGNYTLLKPWLEIQMFSYTQKIGFKVCQSIAALYPPANNQIMPLCVSRLNSDDIVPFITQCRHLGYNIHQIDAVTRSPAYAASLINEDPSILEFLLKTQFFEEAIRTLAWLYDMGKVTLQAGTAKFSSGKSGLKTTELPITVTGTTAQGPFHATFVYHEHPNGQKLNTDHPNITNQHLKPTADSPTKMDASKIPENIKTFLSQNGMHP